MDFTSVKTRALKDLKKYPPDRGIGRYLASINSNPDIVTRSSCSGWRDAQWVEGLEKHSGHPYVWVTFSSRAVAAHYIPALRFWGLNVNAVFMDGNDASWYIEIPNTTNGHGGKAIGSGPNPRRATSEEARRFWQVVTQILSD